MNVCIYFQVHQPFRMKKYSVFDIGQSSEYFDDNKNKEIMHKIAKKCYLRTNNLMLQLINKYKNTDKQFKISYSITGTALEQFQKYAPEVLESFQKLAETGNVEFLSETYYHSLSCLYSKHEFKDQIDMHKIKIKELFNQEPKVFRNTELIFNNELANFIQGMGYKAILAEGADHILGWRSPNYVYTARTAPKLKLLLKNYKLSDDIAFRFGQKSWKEYPLTAEKFAHWINSDKGHSMNLFMDYETFGEHQWDDTGIFDFLKHLPDELFKNNHTRFLTVSELAEFDASSKRLEDVRSGWMVAQKLKKRGITGEIGEEKEIILDGKKTTIKITPDLAEILPKEGLPCLTERELSILGSASVADAEVVEICKKHGLQMMEDRDAPGVERDIYVLFGNSDYKKIKIGLWKGDLGVEISS